MQPQDGRALDDASSGFSVILNNEQTNSELVKENKKNNLLFPSTAQIISIFE